ncbi:uncharacterized protein DNG_06954 [Cephalotrichum gorgonifer]|uniref:C2H2-type domain-containing protein n=1 Tax=Cephalotrichum gorgonifer TaxID=2041049 RepID=A0AAE8N0U0_9PEZI|nr:uncharacterized protein DNG_06954 [Cephalotrichum gorgonifer]
MEIIPSFSLDSSPLNSAFKSDRDFGLSISGPSPPSDSFSTPSSSYGPFTPTSGSSTPPKTLDLDAPYQQQNLFFDMPLQNYPPECFNATECKPSGLNRVSYLGGPCIPDAPPARRATEPTPTTLDYSGFAEMAMPQSYSTSAPMDQSPYELYPMGDRGRPRSFDTSLAPNTVRMSDMCSSNGAYDMCSTESYDMCGSIAGRPSFTSSMPFAPGEQLRNSDTESVGSHTVMSPLPMDTMPSPGLPHRLAMVEIGREIRSPPRRVRSLDTGGRGGDMGDMLMGPPGSGDQGHEGGIEIKRIAAGKHQCEVPGCNKSFNRKEHLKRHVTTTHEEAVIPCPFCKDKSVKPFNRMDNFKNHIKIHSQPRTSGRVEYVPEAVEHYRKLVEGTKPRKPSKRGSASSATKATYRRL